MAQNRESSLVFPRIEHESLVAIDRLINEFYVAITLHPIGNNLWTA
jgi:hypothetical protein